ncbi:probable mitochondrial F1F0 ATP synthase subunit Atp18 [Ramularia collo-cygni]|uniref:Probable mitochondrial F1F0 ATP synthase subunit Atp18 n=1 Tax=Ramularia collo-cygni TaxID=112498 RepID=A0A2D3ULL4_9PEZI|nr:probable mitochondrial F1F0 ATP synthase subunit Atp18 [Ramularia collo-cygni]CZT15112.1 probable mitochondrial F1F0 ATP synthase subunit Atp18 [Ramularia collo-cygni]
MSGLLGKKFPAPIAKPMWPFYTAGIIIAYGISSFAGVLANTDEYKNDPRNPNINKAPKKDH